MLISTLELQVTERQLRNGAQAQVSESRPSLGDTRPWSLNFTGPYLPLLSVSPGAGLVLPICGFPHRSVGEESARNAGDPGSISGSGRSTGEGMGYLLQYLWASLVAQLVKNPPAMQETWVGKFPWRRERLPTSVFLSFPGGSDSKESARNAGDLGSIPGWEDPLEKGMATHSNILAWRIPWTV